MTRGLAICTTVLVCAVSVSVSAEDNVGPLTGGGKLSSSPPVPFTINTPLATSNGGVGIKFSIKPGCYEIRIDEFEISIEREIECKK